MPRQPDLDAIRETWRLRKAGDTEEEIGEKVGRSARQVVNYLNLKWLKKRGLEYLCLQGYVPMRLSESYQESCGRGDHSFLHDPTIRAFITVRLRDDGVNEAGIPMKVETRTCPNCTENISRRDLGIYLD